MSRHMVLRCDEPGCRHIVKVSMYGCPTHWQEIDFHHIHFCYAHRTDGKGQYTKMHKKDKPQ